MAKASFLSLFKAFMDYDDVDLSIPVASQNLAAGAFIEFPQSVDLPRSDTVVNMKIKFEGLDAYWLDFNTSLSIAYPSYSSPTFLKGAYYKVSGTTLTIKPFWLNTTGSTQTIPAHTVKVRATLFIAPF